MTEHIAGKKFDGNDKAKDEVLRWLNEGATDF
jgi:hypothetical protein